MPLPAVNVPLLVRLPLNVTSSLIALFQVAPLFTVTSANDFAPLVEVR